MPPKRPTLADIGESAFLRRLFALLRRSPAGADSRVAVGVGDDAAILRQRGSTVVSQDMLLEDVDFRRRWARCKDIGHKAAAVNLSDMAAMGARPTALVVALAARPSEHVADMLELLGACHRVGLQFGAPLVGGDLSQTTGPLTLSVTVLGEAPPAPWLRHKGQVGDCLMVTGTLGEAALGLHYLEHPKSQAALPAAFVARCVRRQLRPHNRSRLGVALARTRTVMSAADLSDGLGRDVRHVLAPGTGAELNLAALPMARGVAAQSAHIFGDASHAALEGGEDYELVMAVAPAQRARLLALCQAQGVALTQIGTVSARRGIRYLGPASLGGRRGRGYQHFLADTQ